MIEYLPLAGFISIFYIAMGIAIWRPTLDGYTKKAFCALTPWQRGKTALSGCLGWPRYVIA